MVLMVPQAVRVKIRILQAGNRGFTLLELLVVLFLVTLFMAIVLVNVGGLYERFLLRETALNIVRTINRARALSITERAPVILKIDTELNSFWISSRSKGDINRINISKDIRLEGEDVIFSPLGDSTGGVIKITDRKGRAYLIAIDKSTSQVSIERSR